MRSDAPQRDTELTQWWQRTTAADLNAMAWVCHLAAGAGLTLAVLGVATGTYLIATALIT